MGGAGDIGGSLALILDSRTSSSSIACGDGQLLYQLQKSVCGAYVLLVDSGRGYPAVENSVN